MSDPAGVSNPTAVHLADSVVGPVVHVVSPLDSPGLETLVSAVHLLCGWRRADAHVVVSGPSGDGARALALQRFCDELNLTRLWLAGDPTPEMVEAFEQRALASLRWSAALAVAGPVVLADALDSLIGERDGEAA